MISEGPDTMKLTRTLVAMVLFGAAFGYVEAAVVVYLRTICGPVRRQVFPEERHDEVFPLLQLEHLGAAGQMHVLWTELGREFATMIMLAAVALPAAQNFRQWLAGFMIAFGVWDIFYYVFLKLLIDWPESLLTWDILFLIPVPWVGPVIAPVLVAVSMIAAGTAILWRESAGRPIRFGRLHWCLIFGGGLIVIVAFCWDFRHTAAGGWPHPFNWPLFALGEAVGLAGFLRAFCRRECPR